MIHVQVKIGDMRVTATGETSMKAVEELSFFSELPKVCPSCQSDLFFYFRNPKDFTYYGLKCTGQPAHECTFGQKKDGSGLFYKKETWDVAYKKGDGGGRAPEAAPESTAPIEDDIPF